MAKDARTLVLAQLRGDRDRWLDAAAAPGQALPLLGRSERKAALGRDLAAQLLDGCEAALDLGSLEIAAAVREAVADQLRAEGLSPAGIEDYLHRVLLAVEPFTPPGGERLLALLLRGAGNPGLGGQLP